MDRELPTDVRVVTYNVLNDNIFADTNPTRAARFARIAPAINADVWVLQEVISHNQTQVQTLFNTIAPLPGGASWNVYKSSFEAAIVSRYPLSLTRNDISPAGPKQTVPALVDLPNATYSRDLYLMDVHFKAFSGVSEQQQRQNQADAIINWMRDARTAGGQINLASGTPMVVLGDLNLVDGPQPLNTLIDGNIINNATYGVDSPPDWDGTNSNDPMATHNDAGTTTWTWRDDGSGFAPSRLDYVIHTDSTMSAPHRFVLNTVSMSSADRAATGLQQFDVTLDNTGSDYDHLPVVIDFRLGSERTLVWNTSGGNWNTNSTNWLNGTAPAAFVAGDVVRFKDAGVGIVNIQPASVNPSAIFVSNTTGTYQFTGGSIGGTTSLIKSGNGSLTLAAANSFTGGATVASGTLTIGHPDALRESSLEIRSAGRGKTSTGLAEAIVIKSLSIAPGASFDLANNDLVIDYDIASPITTIKQMLVDGRLFSSQSSSLIGLGYGDNSILDLDTFSGQSVDSSALLVKYTYKGDADLDGDVDANDLGKVGLSWLGAGGWTEGDFNYNGIVDVLDMYLLAQNWGAGVGAPLGMSFSEALTQTAQIPEPSAGLALAAVFLLPRRRRLIA